MKKICSIFLITVSLFCFSLQVEAKMVIDAPFIKQMPELPRGCEVTSLAMMLQHAGIDVDKMELAEKVKKVPFKEDGYNTNPDDGFVGDMYTFSKPGLGVYHKPIVELAEKYLPDRIIDLTSEDISKVYEMIDLGSPVWVITNSWYTELPRSQFMTWNTKQGSIDITYRLHSVLLVGYDEQYVYINDPLYTTTKRKINRVNFERSWVQMGKQAVAYLPESTKFFFDTKNHWANESIEFNRLKGFMLGYNDYYFKPNEVLNRGQVALILDRILSEEEKIEKKYMYNFRDIENHYAQDSILRLANAGYITGYPTGEFKPYENVTRAQLAVIITNTLGEYPESKQEKAYQDVPKIHWAYENIQTIAAYQIMNGNKDRFNPGNFINRGEMAVISERLYDVLQAR